MMDHDEIDEVQAARIDRRIGQAFAFARVAVDDPGVMEVFADGSDVAIKDLVPNPHIPGNTFIVEGMTATGESVTVAVGACACNAARDLVESKFWLRPGEQWVCPECRRVYAFDGERIVINEGADAITG